MKLKAAAANVLLMLASIGVTIVLCEIGARFVLNPADYLSVKTVNDDLLGMTIAPGSAGFDQWGFRNPAVPSAVDVVALGDSHTFGNAAMMDDAWPRVLSRDTGRTVYNLGLGGYGPNQYYQLLKTRGLSLHPKWVLCGLYMGDDFENAFSITYGLNRWAWLRQGEWSGVDANIWGNDEPPGRFKSVRNWLSRESMTYRLLVHGVMAGAKENVRFEQAKAAADPAVTVIDLGSDHIREAFRPIGIATRLDQDRREVREGMRITFKLLGEMAKMCRENGCQFGVVIIPTKETVFAEYLQRTPGLHLKDSVDKVIVNERVARKALGDALEREGIPYIDTLPALRAAATRSLYAQTTADMHPGKNGYKVIGDAAASFVAKFASAF
jgi:hypothetical protein